MACAAASIKANAAVVGMTAILRLVLLHVNAVVANLVLLARRKCGEEAQAELPAGDTAVGDAKASISRFQFLLFTFVIVLWLIYGLAIHDWPLIGSNAVTVAPLSVILAMKLKYG